MKALLVLQSFNLCFRRDPVKRFNHALCCAAANVITLSLVLVQPLGLLYSKQQDGGIRMIAIALKLGQGAALILATLTYLSLPRRPILRADNKCVDAERSCSALDRFTFAWASTILQRARTVSGLEIDDLPYISRYMRSSALLESFPAASYNKKPLWRRLVQYFGWAIFWQSTLTIILSVTRFGPQYAMFRLLSALEEGPSTAIWVWVLGLGFSMFFNALLESQLQWTGWSRLAIPVRALLSTLIFTKSTRRGDIAHGRFSKEEKSSEPALSSPLASDDAFEAPKGKTATVPSNASSGEDPRHTPGAITSNLIGVDVQRISELSSFFWFLPASAIRLVVSIAFLYRLIGWQSLLAGVLAWSVTIPVNMLVSRRYGILQHDLMRSRDRKLGTITETLKSIRQIKLSALESRFQTRIKAERVDELGLQWKLYLYQTALFGLLISGPVLLSTASLLVYVHLYGNILPSIAFTTIAVLSQMEFTLAIIPEMLTQAMDGWISICRIAEYLESSEKEDASIDCQDIGFEHASVAWPSDAGKSKDLTDEFQLRGLNIKFPSQKLSVISGPSGSGKSLLLAAILGEARVTSGTFRAQKHMRAGAHLKGFTSQNQWIDDSARAFVSQNQWIDDGTIQSNILFGLPYMQSRYEETLAACSLDSDMRALPDGDLTLVGTNGVNLSGGQRWRLGFARALYSRAGILILDDIMSSVDAVVAQGLLDQASTGSLSKGRTIILATHHSSLCEPRAAYIVRLQDGRVKYAGINEKVDTKSKSESKSEAGNDQTLIHRRPSGQTRHMNSIAQREAHDRRGHGQSKTQSTQDDGKKSTKFIENEERAKGSLQWDLYKRYSYSSGGLSIWLLAISGFLGAMSLELLRVSPSAFIHGAMHPKGEIDRRSGTGTALSMVDCVKIYG